MCRNGWICVLFTVTMVFFAAGWLFADSSDNSAGANSSTGTSSTSSTASSSSTSTSTSQTTQPGASTTDQLTPVPYSPDEFPLWSRDLRRAEVVTVGVFPFALLYTDLMYDLGRYLVYTISGNPDSANYAPWFFAPSTKPAFTANEKLGIVLGSIGVAVIVGVIDFAINSSQRHAAEERLAAQEAAAKAAGKQTGATATEPVQKPETPGQPLANNSPAGQSSGSSTSKNGTSGQ